ncbi:MAG: hypothetical protein UT22_C0019G0006 [Parcubacteria group bacterium GW2011_GWC2_39_11]|nr:MAG: hypothetical protein US88_C0013G0006 [Parcubacteria group bacterium GW2011_GWA2_38_27]KKQ96988.1 MAG: hypothetical protein UT22_C0019G0006 [Parcubacteria group bacterium GW2011_GWC2_39_11]
MLNLMYEKNRKENGMALMDALVGVFLVLIIFLGIFGAYLLGLKVVSQSRSRTDATSIANEKIEAIRNMSYSAVGVIGGYPSGGISQEENVARNGVNFTVTTRIDYINDSFDGVEGDSCPNDYKKADVRVSWSNQFSGDVDLMTDISPNGISQECADVGGTMSVAVFDASGISITGANVDVEDVVSGLEKSCITDSGTCLFVLPEAVGAYKIFVSKDNYSAERTYEKNELVGSVVLANPGKPHATIFEGQVTSISFSIDKLSGMSSDTQAPESVGWWTDIFTDQSKISSMSNVAVIDGEARLEDAHAEPSGYLISSAITSAQLINWKEFSFDNYEPANTSLKYQIFYFVVDLGDWILIPEADLPGNSVGFAVSPIDISGLNAIQYPEIRLKANFSTSDSSSTPVLYGWTISWRKSEPIKIPNLEFHLQGTKSLGTDSNGNPVYKYSEDHISDLSGRIDISDLEWDSYSFAVDKSATGFDLLSTEPVQPVDVLPDTIQPIILNLAAEDTLLATVKDSTSFDPIFAASVRVYNVYLEYDQLLPTNELGKAFFMPLEEANYNIEVQSPGYSIYTGTVFVSGSSAETIQLTRL